MVGERKSLGFFARLSPEQQAAALAYRGPDWHGAAPASPTNAERYVSTWERGRWRRAAKTHRCDHYWTRECLGDGSIHASDRYFDTEELREFTKGPVPFRCCAACAQASSEEPT